MPRVVFDLQRQAGIDLPTDGELYRFDVNHPDTNGMIEHSCTGLAASAPGSAARDGSLPREVGDAVPQPARGRGRRTDGRGHAEPARGARRSVADGGFKVTLTSPYMLARTLLDEHYRDFRD